MADKTNGLWLKVLIGFIITLLLGGFGLMESKKVDKEVFNQHETYQGVQYKEIKATLIRIEEKL